MTYSFKSCFAARIQKFITQKQSLEFLFCMTYFPQKQSLTKELCVAWATKKDEESAKSFCNRLVPIREFARYLIRVGEAAYVLLDNYTKTLHAIPPYIFIRNVKFQLFGTLRRR